MAFDCNARQAAGPALLCRAPRAIARLAAGIAPGQASLLTPTGACPAALLISPSETWRIYLISDADEENHPFSSFLAIVFGL